MYNTSNSIGAFLSEISKGFSCIVLTKKSGKGVYTSQETKFLQGGL